MSVLFSKSVALNSIIHQIKKKAKVADLGFQTVEKAVIPQVDNGKIKKLKRRKK